MVDKELDAMLALASAHALRPQMRVVPNQYITRTDAFGIFTFGEEHTGEVHISYKLYNWWWASEQFPSWVYYLGFAQEEQCHKKKDRRGWLPRARSWLRLRY